VLIVNIVHRAAPIEPEPALPTLPPEWTDHFAAGVSIRLGSCNAAGRPGICRALAAGLEPDGRVIVIVAAQTASEVLQAIGDTRQVSAVFAQPQSNRSLHLKGNDAQVGRFEPAYEVMLRERSDAFFREVAPFGFTREQLMRTWFGVPADGLRTVRFCIAGAWNQTPGPGAGSVVELQP
jgi:hypothetical protein